jgi:hypothetical protein
MKCGARREFQLTEYDRTEAIIGDEKENENEKEPVYPVYFFKLLYVKPFLASPQRLQHGEDIDNNDDNHDYGQKGLEKIYGHDILSYVKEKGKSLCFLQFAVKGTLKIHIAIVGETFCSFFVLARV